MTITDIIQDFVAAGGILGSVAVEQSGCGWQVRIVQAWSKNKDEALADPCKHLSGVHPDGFILGSDGIVGVTVWEHPPDVIYPVGGKYATEWAIICAAWTLGAWDISVSPSGDRYYFVPAWACRDDFASGRVAQDETLLPDGQRSGLPQTGKLKWRKNKGALLTLRLGDSQELRDKQNITAARIEKKKARMAARMAGWMERRKHCRRKGI